jgi:tungstate transport system substrate-binding protein
MTSTRSFHRFFSVSKALALMCWAFAATHSIAQPTGQGAAPVMASTTSTEQSGLFTFLLPEFKKASGIDLRVVAVGTGQAIDMGRRGDADVLFVHDKAAEEQAVAEGFVLPRKDVMYNDFVLIGPAVDPARARGADIAAALQKVGAAGTAFISRGDKSGTHAAELRFWSLAGTAAPDGKPAFAGYRACGCGMGQALNMAASTGAYVLADRGTWLAFKNRADLVVLVEGDRRLFNQYGVLVVNPARHPQARVAEAQQFADWVTSPAGQAVVGAYKIGGQQVFFPNAGK